MEKFEIVCRTDIGQSRDCNQDAVGFESSLGLAVLADGMGGYRAGEIASAMAVDLILKEIKDQYQKAMEITGDTNFSDMASASDLIENAILKVNSSIYAAAKNNIRYKGMGTTAVVAMVYDDVIFIGHVGDSRLYRLREGKLNLLTEDHSLVRELVRKGSYTEAQAREAKNKNVVTRALGVADKVTPEIQQSRVLLDDIYLLCSDGLNDMVEDKEIKNILLRYEKDLDQATDQLIRLANEMGGKDNISAILLRPIKATSKLL